MKFKRGIAIILGLSLATWACSDDDDDGASASRDGGAEDGDAGDAGAADDESPAPAGAIYALTNGHNASEQISAADDADDEDRENAVIAYYRFGDGSLSEIGIYPTGGLGENIRNSGANPLASQDPLIVADDNQLLFAVNPGSDSITSFRIGEDMSLTVASEDVSTRGDSDARNPVSLAYDPDERVLYVVNTGAFFDGDDEADTLPEDRNRTNASVVGFSVDDDGELELLEDSEIPNVGENAGSIEFSTDGSTLIVTQRRTNTIEIIPMEDGLPDRDGEGDIDIETLNANTDQPFGTDVLDLGEGDILLISEGNNGLAGQSALSSYIIDDQDLTEVSESTGEEDDPLLTGFTFGCWVEFAQGPEGAFAYVANTPDGVISSYTVEADGTIEVLEQEAGRAGIEDDDEQNGVGVLDSEVTWPYLYQVVNNDGRIAAWEIAADGELTRLPEDAEIVNTDELRGGMFVGLAGF